MITVTLTGDTPRDVVSQFAALFGLPNPVGTASASASSGSLQNGSVEAQKPTLVEKTDNVTDLAAAAAAKAKAGEAEAKKPGRPRKNAAIAPVPDPASEPEPEPEPEVDEEGQPNEAGLVAEAIDQLTTLYQGGDADLRARIKAWRDEQGLKLLRDLGSPHLAAATRFLDELTA